MMSIPQMFSIFLAIIFLVLTGLYHLGEVEASAYEYSQVTDIAEHAAEKAQYGDPQWTTLLQTINQAMADGKLTRIEHNTINHAYGECMRGIVREQLSGGLNRYQEG
jgi:hypothetical protein